MATTTRKIKKPSAGTKTTKLAGRRGTVGKMVKADEAIIPEAPLEKRRKAFFIDIIFLISFAEFLVYRNAWNVFIENESVALGRLVVYVPVFLFLYVFPMRLFGQSLGMKLLKIKILNASDLSYVNVSALIQRQSIGLLLNMTLGLAKFFKDNTLIADTLFKTKVFEIEKD